MSHPDHDKAVGYLTNSGATLWGRAYDVKSNSVDDAAEWFLQQMDRYQQYVRENHPSPRDRILARVEARHIEREQREDPSGDT